MNTNVNNFAAPNARAVNQLRSWLHAVGIQHKPSSAGNDLSVARADGVQVELQVAMDGSRGPADVVIVRGKTLTGRKLTDALKAFDTLQERLGYKAKAPVDRGPIPDKKAHYTDNFELVAIRHMEFRRSPDPDPKVLKKLDPVLNKACWSFYNRNRTIVDDFGFDFGDLKSHAMIYTTEFLGLHAVPEEKVRDFDNEKLLTVYLGQRFNHLRETMWRKARNLFPSLDAASIAQNNTPYDYENFESWGSTKESDAEEDPDYIARHRKLETCSPSARRSSASIALDQGLTALSHNRLIEVLTEASENTRIHPDAQRLAARKLRDHANACPDCAHLVASSAKMEEDLAGSEPGGPAE